MSVDTSRMDEFELEQLRRNPKWVSVLSFYQKLHVESRNQSAEFDGWTSRIHEVPEIESNELPGIHGKLIAFGFLKFDLSGRDAGIRYQLTPLGKQGISTADLSDTDEENSEASSAENQLSVVGHE